MTTAPKIELRKLSHSKSLSEETPAYTAQIWVDGVFLCDVSNHGQGGGDCYSHEHYPAIAAVEARIKATMPPVHAYGMELEQCLEMICHTLIDDIEVAKDLKRALAKKILFVKPGQKGIYEVKKIAGDDQRLLAAIKDKHKVERTLNEMPFADAIAVYTAA
jgi:hypothetical protein